MRATERFGRIRVGWSCCPGCRPPNAPLEATGQNVFLSTRKNLWLLEIPSGCRRPGRTVAQRQSRRSPTCRISAMAEPVSVLIPSSGEARELSAAALPKRDLVRPRLARSHDCTGRSQDWCETYSVPQSLWITKSSPSPPRPWVTSRASMTSSALVAGHRVADGLAGGQVRPAGGASQPPAVAQAGDVTDQLGPGSLGVEVAADQVWEHLLVRVGRRGPLSAVGQRR